MYKHDQHDEPGVHRDPQAHVTVYSDGGQFDLVASVVEDSDAGFTHVAIKSVSGEWFEPRVEPLAGRVVAKFEDGGSVKGEPGGFKGLREQVLREKQAGTREDGWSDPPENAQLEGAKQIEDRLATALTYVISSLEDLPDFEGFIYGCDGRYQMELRKLAGILQQHDVTPL